MDKPLKINRCIFSKRDCYIQYESTTEPVSELRKYVMFDAKLIWDKFDEEDEGDDDGSDEEPDTEAMTNKNLDHRKLKPKTKKVKPDLMYS